MTTSNRKILLIACLITLFVFHSYSKVKRLEVGLLHREIDLTYKQCIQMCDIKVACSDVKYTRRLWLCELYVTEINQNNSQTGVTYYRKTANDTLKTLCAQCSEIEFCSLEADNSIVSCEPRGCMAPASMPLARVFGSQMYIGSKAKYVCHFDPNMQGYITCLSSGQWSDMDCPCIPREVANAHALVNISTTGSVMAMYNCDEGYELHQRSVPTCDSNNNVYENIEFVCCAKLAALQWKKIFRYNAHTEHSVQKVMVKGADFDGTNVRENCLYRDSVIFEQWLLIQIAIVRLDVIVNETVVAFMEFNGLGSNARTWFRQDRLERSSWNDLDLGTPLDVFSFAGALNGHHIENTDMLIARKNDPQVCTSDEGWFAVSIEHYPCEFTGIHPGYRILYSPIDHASSFDRNEIGLADRFEISILLDSSK